MTHFSHFPTNAKHRGEAVGPCADGSGAACADLLLLLLGPSSYYRCSLTFPPSLLQRLLLT